MEKKCKKLRLVLTQLQEEPSFPNQLPIEVVTAKGRMHVVIDPKGKRTIQEVQLDVAPTSINIDPENTVLKEARVTQNRE
jgi:hypothetical protein